MAKKKRKENDQEAEADGDTSLNPANSNDENVLSYEEKLKFVNVIAKPMASKKMTKRLCKMIRKATKHKNFLYNGLKLVQNKIRKGETGLVVFAGDVTPIDIMSHMPIVCEEKSIPYIFIPSKQDIGIAMGVKRSSLMVMIKDHEDYRDSYNECAEEIKSLDFVPVT